MLINQQFSTRYNLDVLLNDSKDLGTIMKKNNWLLIFFQMFF